MAPFKVMTWNILYGGEDRFEKILALLRQHQPDLLLLEECLGWEGGSRLKEVAEALGLFPKEEHLFLARARPRESGRRYHLAVASRAPMQELRVYNDASFLGHALVALTLELSGERLKVFGA